RRLCDDDRACAAELAAARQMKRAFASDFFACGDHQHSAAGIAKLFRHVSDRSNKRRHSAFHVAGTTAVYLAGHELCAERIDGARCVAERDRIHMTCEAQRGIAIRSTNARDEIRTIGNKAVDRRLESCMHQDLFEMRNTGQFVSWWIDGVECDQ